MHGSIEDAPGVVDSDALVGGGVQHQEGCIKCPDPVSLRLLCDAVEEVLVNGDSSAPECHLDLPR